jgi:beta-glucosidase/6-phospho-beta-glucosidase/beta-galactosidase
VTCYTARKAGGSSLGGVNSFGVLLTSSELEGPPPSSDWSLWIRQGKAPEGNDGAGFGATFEADLAQLAELGVTEAAFTVEWARMFPNEGRVDDEALTFRRQVLEHAVSLGIAPWIVLVDGTLPGWFGADMGGFNDERQNLLVWSRQIDWVGENFGDVAAGWLPMREPVLNTLQRQFLATAPPGKTGAINATKAVRNVMLAEAEAWRLLKGTAPVATSVSARLVRGQKNNVKATPHAEWADELINKSWFHAINEGELRVGDMPTRRVDELRGAFDLVVVHPHSPIEVDAEGSWSDAPIPALEGLTTAAYEATERAGSRNVVWCADLSNVAENGQARTDHLDALVSAASETGAGWWQASPIDGWHWNRGFEANPGVISSDREFKTEAAVLSDIGN